MASWLLALCILSSDYAFLSVRKWGYAFSRLVQLAIKKDLVISKLLGQNIEKYRSLFPHVSAAIQLSGEDRLPSKGDTIKYIYIDSQHKNPLCRVVPVQNTKALYLEDQLPNRRFHRNANDTL